jgi:hypothetical protein
MSQNARHLLGERAQLSVHAGRRKTRVSGIQYRGRPMNPFTFKPAAEANNVALVVEALVAFGIFVMCVTVMARI